MECYYRIPCSSRAKVALVALLNADFPIPVGQNCVFSKDMVKW